MPWIVNYFMKCEFEIPVYAKIPLSVNGLNECQMYFLTEYQTYYSDRFDLRFWPRVSQVDAQKQMIIEPTYLQVPVTRMSG